MSDGMRERFGVLFDPDVLPESEFLSLDRMSLTTHTGTHIDAPSHYGSRAAYRDGPPRNIDQMPLDWFLNRESCSTSATGQGRPWTHRT